MISNFLRRVFLAKGKLPQIQSVRNCYPISCQNNVTMPRVKISPRERVFWLVAIALTMTSLPVWVLYHLPFYRGEKTRQTGIYMEDDI